MVTMPDPAVWERLGQLDILAPIDPDARAKWRAAARLGGLHSKVGGFLGNRKDNAAPLLALIKELLDRRFELSETVSIDKFIYSRPAADEIVDALAERCDFVVTAIAD